MIKIRTNQLLYNDLETNAVKISTHFITLAFKASLPSKPKALGKILVTFIQDQTMLK